MTRSIHHMTVDQVNTLRLALKIAANHYEAVMERTAIPFSWDMTTTEEAPEYRDAGATLRKINDMHALLDQAVNEHFAKS